MLKMQFAKTLTARVAVLCLTVALTGSSAVAQQSQQPKADPVDLRSSDSIAEAAVLGPEDVTVSYVDLESPSGGENSKTALPYVSPDIFWAHGNSGVLEPGPSFSLKTYGWGAEVTKTATAPTGPTYHAWIHYAVPTPTRINFKSSRLRRILVSFKSGGAITQFDVWDGARRILALPMGVSGDHLGGTSENRVIVIDFPSAPHILQGIGVSLKIRGCEYDTSNCPTSVTHIASVGAELSR
jgi:hypothetical protein